MCAVISNLAGSAGAAPQTIYRAGSLGAFAGPENLFTGEVRVEPLYPGPDADSASGAMVHFSKGARSAWHTHPAGQHIVVISGVGWTGYRDGRMEEIRPGDAVWCPPGVEHWHGASPLQAMSHLVVTGSKAGANVVWGEKVTDAEYRRPEDPPAPRHQALAAIAALAASGKVPELETAMAEGLDAGLTVNEEREVLGQMYAYAGFPRCLNAIHALMKVVEQRRAAGKTDRTGRDAGVPPSQPDRDTRGAWVRAGLAGVTELGEPQGFQRFAPEVDGYLKQHLFGDIFGRDLLSFLDREVATVAALAAMPGTSSQLAFHVRAARNAGLSESQLGGILAGLGPILGPGQTEVALEVHATVCEGN